MELKVILIVDQIVVCKHETLLVPRLMREKAAVPSVLNFPLNKS